MVEIDELTLFEILVGVILTVAVPIFVYFWRQNTNITKNQAETSAEIKLLHQKLDNLLEKFNEEKAETKTQHDRIENQQTKMADNLVDVKERLTRLEARK